MTAPRVTTAFLDRDGTINRKAPEGEYVTSPEDLVLLPGAAAAVARLNEAGIRVVLVTNQRGIARGRMMPSDLAAIHDRLDRDLAAAGARIDSIYVCPHEGGCDCRKPGIGLFERARRDQPAIEFARSVVIGDAPSDIAAGRGIGALTIRLATSDAPLEPEADLTVASLRDAVGALLDGAQDSPLTTARPPRDA